MWHFAVRLRRFHIVSGDVMWLLLLLLQPFNRYQKGKTNLVLNEAREDGVLGCSGISWTIYKQSAPPSRQITTPTPHHSIFTGRMLFVTTSQQDKCIEGRWCDVSCVKIQNCLYMLIFLQLPARRLYYLSGTSKITALKSVQQQRLNAVEANWSYGIFFLLFCFTHWVLCVITTVVKITFYIARYALQSTRMRVSPGTFTQV